MGFRKDWDTNAIKHSIWKMAHECSSPYNDGFIQSSIKHELIDLKFLLEDLLEKCPKFAGEQEWYNERLLNKLGKKEPDE